MVHKVTPGDKFVKTFITPELRACKRKEIKPIDLFLLMCVKEGEYCKEKVTPSYLVSETGLSRKHVHEHLERLRERGLVKKRGYGEYAAIYFLDGPVLNCSQKGDSLPETEELNCSQKGDTSTGVDDSNCHQNDYSSVTKTTTVVSPKRLQLSLETPDSEPTKGTSKRKSKSKKEVAAAAAPCEATASRTAKPKPQNPKPKPDTNPDVKIAFESFDHEHSARFGAKYPFIDGKDGKLFKQMLQTCPIDGLKRCIELFFADNDKWLQTTGHTVGTLKTRLPRYIQQQARITRSAKQPELPVPMTEKQLYGEY